MKIRNGFVSNSSSSSFVIIGNKELNIPNIHNSYVNKNMLMIPQTFGGEYEFVTSEEDYNKFADRLNFAALVAWMKEGPQGYDNHDCMWTTMLEEIIQEDLGFEEFKINFQYDDDEWHPVYMNPLNVYSNSFIPHDSHPSHDENTVSIYKDKETLRKFLFAEDSCIKVEYN